MNRTPLFTKIDLGEEKELRPNSAPRVKIVSPLGEVNVTLFGSPESKEYALKIGVESAATDRGEVYLLGAANSVFFGVININGHRSIGMLDPSDYAVHFPADGESLLLIAEKIRKAWKDDNWWRGAAKTLETIAVRAERLYSNILRLG